MAGFRSSVDFTEIAKIINELHNEDDPSLKRRRGGSMVLPPASDLLTTLDISRQHQSAPLLPNFKELQSYHGSYASIPTEENNNKTDYPKLISHEEEPVVEGWRKYITPSGLLLLLITTVMVLARSIDFVLFIRMADKMQNYEYFLSSILLSFGFCMIAWPVVWYLMYKGEITPEMRAFPKRKFIWMGVLDTLNALLGTIPASYVSGSVNVTMSQSIVPINLVASFLFLGVRYQWTHYLGVAIILAGITVDVIPLFLGNGGDNPWFWVLLLFVSYIPAAMSNVYKERHLKGADLNVWYLNAWVAIYQLIFGMMIVPIVFIPLPAPADYVNPKTLPQYVGDSLMCFFGVDSRPGDRCGYMYIVFIVFIIFNMTYNILILVVFKRGSSTLAVVASAARLAVSNLLFLVPFLAGEATRDKLTVYDIVALFVLILGIVTYRLKEETIPKEKLSEEEEKLIN